MNQRDAFERAWGTVGERNVWENKQRLFYQMRHDGLRRVNKPFPTAADSHFPLIDMAIGDLKPFWMAQAFSGERLFDFISLKQDQTAEVSEAAADYLDFRVKYFTNFREEFERASDYMLLRGRGILKIIHEPDKKRYSFKGMDPMWLLMDRAFNDFDDADEFTEIQHLTLAQYKRDRNLDQSDDVINAIRGRTDWDFAGIQLDKQNREGITHSNKQDRIVLWNHYQKRDSDWVLTQYAPAALDKVIRKPFSLPYVWDKEPLLPFYSLTMEIKDEGWYSPRGLAELNAAFEAYCTKLWNEKSDAMTFGNRPLFTGENDITNTANLRFMPGEYVPGNIQAVQMPQTAFSFAEEINFTRSVSEQRSKRPDYGITQEGQEGGSKPRTATENNRIAALQDVGADHNGDVFRNVRLQKIYRHIWALEVQFRGPNFAYYAADSLQTLPEDALHAKYLVIPAGGSGTRQQRLQRATMRFSLFKGAPNIDQDQLARDVIAADDPRLVKKLLLPQNQRQQQEYLDQVIKINAGLADGFPVPPFPSEDQQIRIKACLDWLHKQGMMGAPPNRIAIQSVQMHIAARLQMLQQINPKAAQQAKQMIQQMEMQSAPPQAAPPQGNGGPMLGQGRTQIQLPQQRPQPVM